MLNRQRAWYENDVRGGSVKDRINYNAREFNALKKWMKDNSSMKGTIFYLHGILNQIDSYYVMGRLGLTYVDYLMLYPVCRNLQLRKTVHLIAKSVVDFLVEAGFKAEATEIGWNVSVPEETQSKVIPRYKKIKDAPLFNSFGVYI